MVFGFRMDWYMFKPLEVKASISKADVRKGGPEAIEKTVHLLSPLETCHDQPCSFCFVSHVLFFMLSSHLNEEDYGHKTVCFQLQMRDKQLEA